MPLKNGFYVSAAADPGKQRVGVEKAVILRDEPLTLVDGNSTVEYVARVWCKNADYWDVYFNLNENVREAFAEKGVKFSYEHVNVHIVEK